MAETEWLDCHGLMGGRSKDDCVAEAKIMFRALISRGFRIIPPAKGGSAK